MWGTLDYFNEEKCPFEEPIWYEAPKASIHSFEEFEFAMSACPFPFEPEEDPFSL